MLHGSPGLVRAFAAAEALDSDFASWARAHRLDGPMLWAGLLQGEIVDEDRDKMIDILHGRGALGLSADAESRRFDIAVELARVARHDGAETTLFVSGESYAVSSSLADAICAGEGFGLEGWNESDLEVLQSLLTSEDLLLVSA